MRIAHVAETVKGGVGNYLNELVHHHCGLYGAENVALAVPGDQSVHLSPGIQDQLTELPPQKRGAAGIWELWRAVRAFVRAQRPDVLFLHSSFAGLVGRVQLNKLAKQVIYIPHSWSFQMAEGRGDRGKAWLYALIERALLYRTDTVICVSEAERADAKRFGLSVDKIVAIPTGIAERSPQSADVREPTQADGPTRICFIGRLSEQKGLSVLLETIALSAPPHRQPGQAAHFDVVGDSDDDPDLLNRLKVLPHVTVHGWVSREEAARILDQSDVLYMPSAWEGLPLTALESLRAAKPLLCSNIDVLREIIETHDAGCVARTADEAHGILVRTTREAWKSLGQNARRAFEREYQFDVMARRIDALLLRGV